MDSNTLNLAIQLLAAGAQDIGSGNPLGTNLNNAVMGNVAAKSQGMTNQKVLKMLAQLMGDANDSTTPGKVTTDGKKFTYSTELGEEMSDLGKSLFPAAAGNAGGGGAAGLNPVGLNPFR